MSDAPRAYSPFYIRAWTVLSIVLGLVLFIMFAWGDHLMHGGHVTWALLRWLCRGII